VVVLHDYVLMRLFDMNTTIDKVNFDELPEIIDRYEILNSSIHCSLMMDKKPMLLETLF